MSDAHLQRVWLRKNRDGYQDRIEHGTDLNDNSKELVAFIVDNEVIVGGAAMSVHELGSGSGRNLKYLKALFPDLRLSANDLDSASVFGSMDGSLRKSLTFKQADTYRYLRECVESGEQVDVLLAFDHLMHLSRQVIPDVYALMARYARAAIVLREPDGDLVQLQSGGGKELFVWAADRFDDRFPGFVLRASLACKNATSEKRYRLMWFARKETSQGGKN